MMTIYKPKREAWEETNCTDILTLNFCSPEYEKMDFCCLSHLVHGALFWQPEQTNTQVWVVYILNWDCLSILAGERWPLGPLWWATKNISLLSWAKALILLAGYCLLRKREQSPVFHPLSPLPDDFVSVPLMSRQYQSIRKHHFSHIQLTLHFPLVRAQPKGSKWEWKGRQGRKGGSRKKNQLYNTFFILPNPALLWCVSDQIYLICGTQPLH